MENMCCCVQARCLLQLTAARTAADGKTFKKPRRPFEKERLDSELKLVGEGEPAAGGAACSQPSRACVGRPDALSPEWELVCRKAL